MVFSFTQTLLIELEEIFLDSDTYETIHNRVCHLTKITIICDPILISDYLIVSVNFHLKKIRIDIIKVKFLDGTLLAENI